MSRYLTLKAALLEPENLNRQMELTAGTANLLVQVFGIKTSASVLPDTFLAVCWLRREAVVNLF